MPDQPEFIEIEDDIEDNIDDDVEYIPLKKACSKNFSLFINKVFTISFLFVIVRESKKISNSLLIFTNNKQNG